MLCPRGSSTTSDKRSSSRYSERLCDAFWASAKCDWASVRRGCCWHSCFENERICGIRDSLAGQSVWVSSDSWTHFQTSVRPGDLVEKNQVVAEMSSRELELVRLDFLQAKNDLALNLRLLEMTRPSAQAGAVPMQRLLDIENGVEQSRNRLEVSELRARTLGVSLQSSQLDPSSELLFPLRSPIGGRILHSDLAEGKYVEAFEHLFEIVNTDEVWVRLQLLEKDIFNVKVGNRVSVHFPSSSLSVEGVIDRMDAVLDSKTQVISAWVTLNHPSVIPGLVGSATIYTSEQADTITVPQRAIHSDGLQTIFLSRKHRLGRPLSIVRRPCGLVVAN